MVDLIPIDAEPVGEDVVATLEAALVKAKAGELSSVGVAMVFRDGSTDRTWSEAPSIGTLIGAASRLHAALIRQVDGV